MDGPRDIARGLLGPAYQPVEDFAVGLFGVLDPREDLETFYGGGRKVMSGDPATMAAGVADQATGLLGMVGGPLMDAVTTGGKLAMPVISTLRSPSWSNLPPYNVHKNPGINELARQVKNDGPLKALYDPSTETWITWRAEGGAFHDEMADFLEESGNLVYNKKSPYERLYINTAREAADLIKSRKK